MPRQRRIEYEGALYHVMAHGDERKAMMALAIKAHKTMPLGSVAERLHMGTCITP